MSKQKKNRRIPCTDTGNAELIANLFGNVLRYDHKQGRWLIWNNKCHRWSEDKVNGIRHFAIVAARQRRMTAACLADPETSKYEIRWAFESEDRHKLDAALELAKSEAPISDDGQGWDADPWIFGVANGIVDLRTGTLRLATQEDRITKFSPVAFDAAAKRPRFDKFLNEIFDCDLALIEYVQKAVGYSATGITREQCLFACFGEGSNGKSTFLETILHILGDHGIDLPFSVLEAKQYGSTAGEGVNLVGSRFAKAVEIREGRRLDEARVKSWTGGDTISVRPLYRNSFSFRPTHKLWLAFNHKPHIGDDSIAMWRRIRLIPFLHMFDSSHAEKGLLEKLKAEASGILNWAIEGCLAWQKDGLKEPAAVADATAEYEADSDPLSPFFEDCCEMDDGFQIPICELWNAYKGWCSANKEQLTSRKVFADKMKSRGFVQGSTGVVRYWRGLRLRSADTTDTTKGDIQGLPVEQLSMEESRKMAQTASVASEMSN